MTIFGYLMAGCLGIVIIGALMWVSGKIPVFEKNDSIPKNYKRAMLCSFCVTGLINLLLPEGIIKLVFQILTTIFLLLIVLGFGYSLYSLKKRKGIEDV
ncbi:hypothetical protein DA717_10945 [Piscirickettsiaceae bacterium NZ-RLO2]|uniref:hypothetical protein n=1 Tax=Piscirickettsia salmonis TaxID=1238 RepID=UPI000F082781|nr:hypothetical protein [Piscirickettsia salmonis]QGP55359.1 hypothetical protein PsalSR1_02804 [Piscirickettsia salmonis]QGP58781.1 hypothetical protein PsalBI1_01362 [Piscirickettsia salmonis]QGP64925.1 hypothetical protein PsalMR5_02805 [Piscirickettsia salmonis]RNC77317.1 hypothetical protein DA717_10945 [Piscirickettsiaceae bacterium NZ-RLO2]